MIKSFEIDSRWRMLGEDRICATVNAKSAKCFGFLKRERIYDLLASGEPMNLKVHSGGTIETICEKRAGK